MSTAIGKRIDRAIQQGYTGQPRHGACLLCLQDWDGCPHTRAEVDRLFEARKLQRDMAILGELNSGR